MSDTNKEMDQRCRMAAMSLQLACDRRPRESELLMREEIMRFAKAEIARALEKDRERIRGDLFVCCPRLFGEYREDYDTAVRIIMDKPEVKP